MIEGVATGSFSERMAATLTAYERIALKLIRHFAEPTTIETAVVIGAFIWRQAAVQTGLAAPSPLLSSDPNSAFQRDLTRRLSRHEDPIEAIRKVIQLVGTDDDSAQVDWKAVFIAARQAFGYETKVRPGFE